MKMLQSSYAHFAWLFLPHKSLNKAFLGLWWVLVSSAARHSDAWREGFL